MKKEKNFMYRLLKPIYTVLLKILFRPQIIGKENIPKDGALIFAGNHKHAVDPTMVMMSTNRVVHYMAKEELFKGIHGWLFNKIGLIKVHRGKSNPQAGIDAEVGNNIEVLRNTIIPTSQLYNASIIYTFINYKFKKVKFKTDIKTFESSYSIISICNGGYYGGGFNIAPKSLLTDGILDIYYVEKMPKLKMIPLLLKLKNGKHEGKRKVHKFRTSHIELKLEEKITFNVDGEKLTDNKFIIDILPKAITVYNDSEFVEQIMKQ